MNTNAFIELDKFKTYGTQAVGESAGDPCLGATSTHYEYVFDEAIDATQYYGLETDIKIDTPLVLFIKFIADGKEFSAKTTLVGGGYRRILLPFEYFGIKGEQSKITQINFDADIPFAITNTHIKLGKTIALTKIDDSSFCVTSCEKYNQAIDFLADDSSVKFSSDGFTLKPFESVTITVDKPCVVTAVPNGMAPNSESVNLFTNS